MRRRGPGSLIIGVKVEHCGPQKDREEAENVDKRKTKKSQNFGIENWFEIFQHCVIEYLIAAIGIRNQEILWLRRTPVCTQF